MKRMIPPWKSLELNGKKEKKMAGFCRRFQRTGHEHVDSGDGSHWSGGWRILKWPEQEIRAAREKKSARCCDRPVVRRWEMHREMRRHAMHKSKKCFVRQIWRRVRTWLFLSVRVYRWVVGRQSPINVPLPPPTDTTFHNAQTGPSKAFVYHNACAFIPAIKDLSEQGITAYLQTKNKKIKETFYIKCSRHGICPKIYTAGF